MQIRMVAADSMGARSMCTSVWTKDISVLIDPSVALGPWRFNRPPHPVEIKRRAELWGRVKAFAEKADILIVTHYHYDHHNPEHADLFKDKILLIKHPYENINKSQRGRSAFFLAQVWDAADTVQYDDGRAFEFGSTSLGFSPAVPHGINNKLGYVTEVCIDDGRRRFVYTSDVEGPSLKEQTDFILKSKPDVLYCDGPMTYMLGFRYPKESLERSVKNLRLIIDHTDVKTIILDHHLLRDARWAEHMAPVQDTANAAGVKIETAASFMRQPNRLYEANRNLLYLERPVEKSVVKKNYWQD